MSTTNIYSNGNNGGHSNSIEEEFNEIKNRRGWHPLFQEIREKCDKEANEKNFIVSESEKPQNRCLNRYRDVNPYDHSRIVIHRGESDYINANLVKCERADRKYILTQGPLSDTIGHFWLMVWEQKTKAILMLNKLMEKKQIKCHMYWPERKGPENSLKLIDVNISVELLECEEYVNFCRRWFRLTDLESNQSREILQFHYTTWPDFGIPSSPVAFLHFLKQVRDSGVLESNVGPAVVHCSAGIGRSGTFCLVDCCLVLIDREGENSVSVQDILYELRRYRMGLIQTADQLYFSYQAIIEGIRLLKDPNFIDFCETPIKDDQQQMLLLDESPPPLPPRTYSLQLTSPSPGLALNNKPLPCIPNSESFNDEIMIAADFKNHDAINNFINSEKNANDLSSVNRDLPIASSISNRPLPPIPIPHQQNSLDKVYESESDENELYEDDDSDENENNDIASLSENNLDTSTIPADNGNSSSLNTNKSTAAAHQKAIINNGIDMLPINNQSTENELKRRKRVERQANIEQKVQDIKRKQREVEDDEKSTKKRRLLAKYIAAGVLVGVLCVYAYTKYG